MLEKILFEETQIKHDDEALVTLEIIVAQCQKMRNFVKKFKIKIPQKLKCFNDLIKGCFESLICIDILCCSMTCLRKVPQNEITLSPETKIILNENQGCQNKVQKK